MRRADNKKERESPRPPTEHGAGARRLSCSRRSFSVSASEAWWARSLPRCRSAHIVGREGAKSPVRHTRGIHESRSSRAERPLDRACERDDRRLAHCADHRHLVLPAVEELSSAGPRTFNGRFLASERNDPDLHAEHRFRAAGRYRGNGAGRLFGNRRDERGSAPPIGHRAVPNRERLGRPAAAAPLPTRLLTARMDTDWRTDRIERHLCPASSAVQPAPGSFFVARQRVAGWAQRDVGARYGQCLHAGPHHVLPGRPWSRAQRRRPSRAVDLFDRRPRIGRRQHGRVQLRCSPTRRTRSRSRSTTTGPSCFTASRTRASPSPRHRTARSPSMRVFGDRS